MKMLIAIGFALLAAFAGPQARAQDALQVPQSVAQIQLSFAAVVKTAAPAVVNIYTKRRVQVRMPFSPFMNDPLFGQFLGGGSLPRERVVSSLGSGVIVGADGTIVTSHHVIQKADEIRVVLADRSEYDAAIVKVDERSDLAVLKVKAAVPLPYLELRDSDTLEVGDIVLAIGNPFGVGQTVTQGIVSALARPAGGVSDYQFFIQTDAAINPGNSGGALVDTQGRLTGINTAIYSTTGGSNGIGFAIPANMVQAVLAGQAADGRVVPPWFGVSAQEVTGSIADSLAMGHPRGVLLREVAPGGPAEKAGLKSGDVILSVGGRLVSSERELGYRIATLGIGKPVPVRLWRGGKELDLEVVPVATVSVENTPGAALLEGEHPLAGIAVTDITPAIASELGLPAGAEGVVVTKARTGGRQLLGMSLRAGDVILQVNRASVTSVAQLRKLLKMRGDGWQITFQRGKSITTLSVMP